MTEWASVTPVSSTVVAAGASVLVGSLTATELNSIVPCTLVRVRGRILWQSDQAAADEDQFGAFGICKVRDEARAAGVGSMPDPITNAPSDFWLAWEALLQTGRSGIVSGGERELNVVFDNKAMRKVVDGDALVLLAANQGAHGAVIAVSLRFLFLLH